MSGVVYLLHLEGRGLPVAQGRVARHYIGWSGSMYSLPLRISHHRAGTGASVCRAYAQVGDLVLARIWHGETRAYERRLKRTKHAPRYCPLCAVEEGRGFDLGPDRDRMSRSELNVVKRVLHDHRERIARVAATISLSIDARAEVTSRSGSSCPGDAEATTRAAGSRST